MGDIRTAFRQHVGNIEARIVKVQIPYFPAIPVMNFRLKESRSRNEIPTNQNLRCVRSRQHASSKEPQTANGDWLTDTLFILCVPRSFCRQCTVSRLWLKPTTRRHEGGVTKSVSQKRDSVFAVVRVIKKTSFILFRQKSLPGGSNPFVQPSLSVYARVWCGVDLRPLGFVSDCVAGSSLTGL